MRRQSRSSIALASLSNNNPLMAYQQRLCRCDGPHVARSADDSRAAFCRDQTMCGPPFSWCGCICGGDCGPGVVGSARPWKSMGAIPATRGDGFQRRMTGTRSPSSTVSLAAAPTMSDEGVGHRADMTHAIRILGARPSARRARQASRSGWADRIRSVMFGYVLAVSQKDGKSWLGWH